MFLTYISMSLLRDTQSILVIINRTKVNNFHEYGFFHILKYFLKLDSQKLHYWIRKKEHWRLWRDCQIILMRTSCVCLVAQLGLFVTSWTVARQAPLLMEFSRQESWCGLPFPTPGDLADPRIEPRSPVAPAPAGTFLFRCMSIPFHLSFSKQVILSTRSIHSIHSL